MASSKSRPTCRVVRVLINLDAGDKAWLEHEASVRNLSMAELVRHTVRDYRLRCQSYVQSDLQGALRRTAGIWQHSDGSSYQQFLREEWGQHE